MFTVGVDDSMCVHFVNLSKISLVFKILASFNIIIVLSINSYLTQLSQSYLPMVKVYYNKLKDSNARLISVHRLASTQSILIRKELLF